MINGPSYEVWCDSPEHESDGVQSFGSTKLMAWEVAKKRGWRYIDGKHVCPVCVDARSRRVP